jgi:murein DD-endopeptidase MepM/ murein hydrolase activator NlpD
VVVVVRLGRVVTTALAVTTLVGAVVPAAVAGDDPRTKKKAVDAKVAVLKSAVQVSAAQVVAATTALDSANAKLPVAQARLASARQALAGAKDAEAAATTRLAQTSIEGVRTAMTADHVTEDMLAHRSAVGALARQVYIGGDLARLGVALGARSPQDFTSALQFARVVSRSERATLDNLDAERRSLAFQQARLVALREQQRIDTQAAHDAVERGGQAAADADDANTDVENLIALRGKALGDAEKLKAAVEATFAAEEAESNRLAKEIAERAAAARRAHRGLPVPLGDGILSFPVIGPITSPFGMRYHPILHRWKLHTGTDFGVPSGTAVRAAADGVVLEDLHNVAYGNRVVIDHGLVGGGYLVTTYNHLSRWVVHKGQQVKRGQVVAYSGNTGWTTGPHLHFEVLIDGKFVNPMSWLRSLRAAS